MTVEEFVAEVVAWENQGNHQQAIETAITWGNIRFEDGKRVKQ